MKSKLRILPVIILVFACFFMTACKKVYYWEVAQSVENIAKIEIVKIENSVVTSVICEIASEDYEELINDVQTMPARKYFGSPKRPKGNVIKIFFMDGTYDEFSMCEPRHITEPEYGYGHSKITWLYYDEEKFDQLIDKWMERSATN